MTADILHRLAYITGVLVAVSFVIVFATYVVPASAANLLLGEQATPDDIKTLERQLGLDRPFAVQYVTRLRDVVTGTWGESLIMKQPGARLVTSGEQGA
jgi:peptide/nickel transport system permease protein